MKKLLKITLTLTLTLILLFGCNQRVNNKIDKSNTLFKTKTLEPENNFDNKTIEIIIIDSCEYIWVKQSNSGGLTHKGDCKNKNHI